MTECSISEQDLWNLVQTNQMDGSGAALAGHVDQCPVCQERLDEMRQLQLSLETVGQMTTPHVPAKIGPYRIIRRIGEGGMGVVYEGQQDHPSRRVAIKVIRAATVPNYRRFRLFRREIEALGRLCHASIARIYDVGQTKDGEPYFAMELVEGRPFDRYCDRHKPSLRDRLSLFIRVVRVVSYAHQRGVIHRDVKPANILVDE